MLAEVLKSLVQYLTKKITEKTITSFQEIFKIKQVHLCEINAVRIWTCEAYRIRRQILSVTKFPN